MKILIYGLNYAPELTGIGKYTSEMAEWLAVQGHKVKVICAPPYYPQWKVGSGYSAWLYKKENLNGVTVWRSPLYVPSQVNGWKRILHLISFSIFSFPILLMQIFWRPGVVFTIAPSLLCALPAWFVAKLSRAHSWLHLQDFEVDSAFSLNILSGSLVKRMALFFESTIFKMFDRCSSISERMVEKLAIKGVSAERIVLFGNWVDTNQIKPIEGRENSIRNELNIDGNVVALYAGNFGEKQGLDVLVKVAAELQKNPTLVFVFCGAGAVKERLVRQLEPFKNTRVIDLQPIEKLNELLNMADIHLLPQRADAADLVMPSKLTGIMASGRPVVVSCHRKTGLAAVIETSQAGLVVPPEDATSFARAVESLAESPEKRRFHGAQARNYAATYLAKDRILKVFEASMLSLVGEKSR